MSESPLNYVRVIPRGKIHMALNIEREAGVPPVCDHNEVIREVIAPTPGGGARELLADLIERGWRPSHLCAHCFGPRERGMLARHYRAQREAARNP